MVFLLVTKAAGDFFVGDKGRAWTTVFWRQVGHASVFAVDAGGTEFFLCGFFQRWRWLGLVSSVLIDTGRFFFILSPFFAAVLSVAVGDVLFSLLFSFFGHV